MKSVLVVLATIPALAMTAATPTEPYGDLANEPGFHLNKKQELTTGLRCDLNTERKLRNVPCDAVPTSGTRASGQHLMLVCTVNIDGTNWYKTANNEWVRRLEVLPIKCKPLPPCDI
ncbi:uncharacterized protein N7503_009385 [Penicillium pulvis]|uniref:uncharacterized protein n=1 Tax=Penicillium pulvis TaxID=1562058 RepID=UPI0025486E99|nr:uncharacterized protein N7503_009385 [Penicillium pulvis]KAJ5784173.1 hypothetical protein N7503_009385 [Penicillium pulvis]